MIDQAIHNILLTGRNSFLCECDISSAFKLLPIRPSLVPYYGCRWNNLFYFFVRLPFGGRSSPRIFDCFSQALEWILCNNYSIRYCQHLLDGFLTIDSTEEEGLRTMAILTTIFMLSINTPHRKHELHIVKSFIRLSWLWLGRSSQNELVNIGGRVGRSRIRSEYLTNNRIGLAPSREENRDWSECVHSIRAFTPWWTRACSACDHRRHRVSRLFQPRVFSGRDRLGGRSHPPDRTRVREKGVGLRVKWSVLPIPSGRFPPSSEMSCLRTSR